MIAPILDHLWQSTVILCLAGLATQLLRRNSAGARYWLWFAASVKFLIPLSLLTALSCRLLPVPRLPVLSAPASELGQRLSEPFVQAPSLPSAVAGGPVPVPAGHLSTVLLVVWGVGCAAVLSSWVIRWCRIRRALSSAKPLWPSSLEVPIPLRESPGLVEPGLVGFWGPVILVPAGLIERLTSAEVRGILAHELCHYRRRDNLTAAVHMLVEALFWFYPPIWWLGARLIAERERACDEAVLAAGNDAEIYAGSILKVCRYFKQTAIACTSGVSGADLRRRVEEIMNSRNAFPVGRAKKLIISLSIAGSLFGMVLFGALRGPVARAEASASAAPAPAQQATLLSEQEQDQNEGVFIPRDFDRFAGYYEDETSALYARVYRNGAHYYSQFTGRPRAEFYPEGPTTFFAPAVGIYIRFVTAPDGQISGMFLRQSGPLRPWFRISKSTFDAATAELQRRIRENTPSPGTDASLLRWIQSWQRQGRPNYEDMEPAVAAVAREEAPLTADLFQQLGSLKSLSFLRVNPVGMDVYLGTFAHGQATFNIGPLDSSGKVVSRGWEVLP